jgi:hypothetical protein
MSEGQTPGEVYWQEQAKLARAELELAMRTIDRQNADLRELRALLAPKDPQ